MKERIGVGRGIKIFIAGLLFLLQISSVFSQNARIHEQYRFKYITVDEGLSNNRIRGLVQDHYGFIWIGTRTGIGKYDGYTVKSYETYFIDTNEIDFSETRGSICDPFGTVWFVGSYGVCYYNIEKDRFEKLVDEVYPDRNIQTLGIDVDKDSVLWFTNSGEIFSYDPRKKVFNYFVSNPGDPGSLPAGTPERLAVDERNNIWIGYQDIGAAYFDRELNKFTHFTCIPDDPTTIAENYIERVYIDDEGIVWFGHNNNGLSKFTWETRSFTRYFPDPSIKQSGRVRGLLKDKRGQFWVGTQFGLYLFNPKNETFLWYAHDKHPISALSHNSIQLIKTDDQEGLWLGTFAGGVSFTNLNTSGFIRYDYSPFDNPYYLNDKNVYSLAVDNNGNVWAGTENGGLNFLDRETGKFTYYKNDPDNSNSPLSNNIKEIIVDEDNNLWFCSYKGGFSFFNTSTNQFIHYLKNSNNPDGFPEPNVYCLLFDPVSSNILWAGTLDGLYYFDINTKEYVLISPSLEAFENTPEIPGQVFTLNRLDTKVLIGADRLIVLDYNLNAFKEFSSIEGITVQSVNFIHVDKMGKVWFDINNEYLVRMEPSDYTFKVLGKRNGLPKIRLLEAADDKMGNLWVSSDKGLYQLMNVVKKQDTVIYRKYDKSDNLQSQEFLYHSKAESKEGEIFFGGINGFNSFIPEKVVINPYPPSVQLTNLKVANSIVGINEEVYGKVLLTRPLIETKSISLHHKIKVFSIEFAGLHYVAPENNKFKFMLEGYDDHWTYTDASVRFATYSNLPPSRKGYIFRVFAANNNGLWSLEPAILKIIVRPPYWKTWWFYSIIGFTLLIGVIVFIRVREEQLKHDKETLEVKLQKGEEELNKRKAEIEKQKKTLEDKEMSERVQKWFNEGLAKFSDILSKEKNNIGQLTQQLITNIVEYIDVIQGGIFLVNDEQEEDQFLELVASYSYNKEKLEKKKFYPGEGQVGVCYKSKEVLQVGNLPESYSKMSSGLGQTTINNLLLVPLKRDDTIIGVIELASFNKVEQFRVEFLEKLSENIVSVIATVKANSLIQNMLTKTQLQAEQMQAQEEELRQNMEEMQATQDEADRREKKLEDENKKLHKRIEDLARDNIEKEKKILELRKKK
ncbi:MAG: GAF domain-containing protein [Bacteroidales bacterium]|nr:GAF domain-containing protein [Bacteroidales bacterium]